MKHKLLFFVSCLLAFGNAKSQCPPPTPLNGYQLNAPCNKFTFEWSGSTPFYKIKVYAEGQFIYASEYISATSVTISKPGFHVDPGISFKWKVRGGCELGDGHIVSDWVEGPAFETFECRTSLVTEISESDAKIFPNPSYGPFTIDVNLNTGASTAIVEVLSVIGQPIHAEEVPVVDGKLFSTIELTDVMQGVYFVRVIAGNSIVTRKLEIVK